MHHKGKMKRLENILLFLLSQTECLVESVLKDQGEREDLPDLSYGLLGAQTLYAEVCRWWLGTFFRGKRTETLVTKKGYEIAHFIDWKLVQRRV